MNVMFLLYIAQMTIFTKYIYKKHLMRFLRDIIDLQERKIFPQDCLKYPFRRILLVCAIAYTIFSTLLIYITKGDFKGILMIIVTTTNIYIVILISTLAHLIRIMYRDVGNLIMNGNNNIRDVKKITGIIFNITKKFNFLFGRQIFALLGLSFFDILTLYEEFFILSFDLSLIPRFVHVSLFMTCSVNIIFACHWATEEGRNLIKTCQEVELRCSFSSRRIELSLLSTHLYYEDPVFTAAGFFRINKGTTMLLISSTVNYFIVLVQLNST
ncbi:unnamed protein product [Brassicogethes aeneus]|uniref:Gustatory receptor n=1 Tax=Brassicogethes aeneus TaxID=1431903 RepID=A0A9P0BJN9_BRAAE|nr:unnamed protein product [Brassicogethes aeneus]